MTPRATRHQPRDTTSRDFVAIAARAILCATIAVVYLRLYFGFAFFDEAYSLALPYAFSLGVRPFVDEPSIYPLAGLLLQPIVEAYLAVAKSNAGLVLFSRHLYFVAAIFGAWVARRFWKQRIGTAAADLLASIVVAYVPFCIFGLSYNTISYFGLLVGTTLLASARSPGHRARNLFAATLVLAVVSFVYPPMFMVTAPALGIGTYIAVRASGSGERLGVLSSAIFAALLSLVVGGGTLVWFGFPDMFDEVLEFSRAQGAQGGGALKWKAIATELAFQWRLLVATALTVAACGVAVTRPASVRVRTAAAMLFGPALAYASTFYRPFHAPWTTVPFILSVVGLFAPAALFAARAHLARAERTALWLIVGTSWMAGLCIAWSSANGLRNLALGMTPAALVSLACMVVLARPGDPSPGTSTSPRPSTPLPAALVLIALIVVQSHQLWTHAYREYEPRRLHTRIESGPWAGIRTTEQKKKFLDQLERDLARSRGDAETILFYDYFPAGYLLTDLVPNAPGLWLFPTGRVLQGNAGLRRLYADRMRSRDALPDLVVRMRCLPVFPFTPLTIPPGDPLDALFDREHDESTLERECYSISKRSRSARRPRSETDEQAGVE